MPMLSRIIRTVYGSELRSEARAEMVEVRATTRPVTRQVRFLPGPRLSILQRVRRAVSPASPTLWVAVSATLLVLLGLLTVHYFNKLKTELWDGLASRAKVDSALQRRNDLTLSLEKAVAAYSRHEATVFAQVSDRRVQLGRGPRPEAGMLSAPKLPPIATVPTSAAPLLSGPLNPGFDSLSKLLAIAEQYPQVRLSENVQTAMKALVDIERDLDKARKEHIDKVNRYMHDTDTFPGKVFARLFGFETMPFFEAGPEARRLAAAKY